MYQIIAEINTRDKLKLVELANQIDGYHGVGEESKKGESQEQERGKDEEGT